MIGRLLCLFGRTGDNRCTICGRDRPECRRRVEESLRSADALDVTDAEILDFVRATSQTPGSSTTIKVTLSTGQEIEFSFTNQVNE